MEKKLQAKKNNPKSYKLSRPHCLPSTAILVKQSKEDLYKSNIIKMKKSIQAMELYEVNIAELKESLRKIEETYYSSNIKLERIKKKKPFEIVEEKIKAYKLLFSKS